MKNDRSVSGMRWTAFAVLTAVGLMVAPAAFAQKGDALPQSHDGLVQVPDSKMAAAYMDPSADLSVYNKIMILDCHVAFKKDWEKDRRTGSVLRVTASDMERIKADAAALFRDVFTEKLSEDGGYDIVNAAGDDVLLVRPAIIDLDVSAPDTFTAGRSRTYTATAGSATLYVELYDSTTGDILARAVDRKTARNAGGYLTYSNRVTNRSEARRMLGKWADQLRSKLDELHGK